MQRIERNYRREGIESITLPALGCGLGNLHWQDVGPMMCRYLKEVDIRSCIYLPMEEWLEKEHLSPNFYWVDLARLFRDSPWRRSYGRERKIGEGGIRTHGPLQGGHSISSRARSAAPAPLRAIRR